MYLAREKILASQDGSTAWNELCDLFKRGVEAFPVHLWVAGTEGTVVYWGGENGISEMQRRMPAAACSIREWPGAGHSIHNTDQDAFVAALMNVIDDAAAAGA